MPPPWRPRPGSAGTPARSRLSSTPWPGSLPCWRPCASGRPTGHDGGMRQLLPTAVDAADPATVYADPPLQTAADRPAVRLNMISSVDGGTTVDGLSGGLGGPGDKAVYAALRSLTDAVLVAAGTARAEHYGPARLPDEVQKARVERGQTAVPTIAVISKNCVFDWAAPFFTEATVRPVV